MNAPAAALAPTIALPPAAREVLPTLPLLTTRMSDRWHAIAAERAGKKRALWCVPSAVAMLAGCSYEGAEAMIRPHLQGRRWTRPILGLHDQEFVPVLRALGGWAPGSLTYRRFTVHALDAEFRGVNVVLAVRINDHLLLTYAGLRFDNRVCGEALTLAPFTMGRRVVSDAWAFPAERVLRGIVT